MTKARPYDEALLPPPTAGSAAVGMGDLCFVAIPLETFRALSDEAARRNITLAQLFQKAFAGVLSQGPRLLVEGSR